MTAARGIRTGGLQRHALAAVSAPHLLDVRPGLERLGKVADVAFDVFIAVHGERNNGLETFG
jgi:hypothetical protein